MSCVFNGSLVLIPYLSTHNALKSYYATQNIRDGATRRKTHSGYATQNIRVPLKLYDDLEKAIIDYTGKNGMKLKGTTLQLLIIRFYLIVYVIVPSFYR